MTAHDHQVSLPVHEVRLGGAAGRLTGIAGAIGVLGLLASALLGFARADSERFYLSYLVSFSYFLSLTLGALFFVLLQHLTQSGWSVSVRRIAEGFAANASMLAVLFVPLLFGLGSLYEWTQPEHVAGDHLLQAKSGYLNPVFFFVRLVVYFGAWILMSRFFFRQSVLQDRTGDPEITTRMRKRSAPAVFVFALTLTFCAFDLLMSLEPHWFSTIFGVYFFSGSVLGFFAVLPVSAFFLQRSGRLRGLVTTEHFHDLGKLVFAFAVFWAYIAFSQYMLYWYANIPEETEWFLRRQTGEWTAVSWLLLVGHFIVPFLALISRVPKRRRGVLVTVAIWILFMHWVDLYYVVMPHASEGRVPLGLLDLTTFLGIGGIWVAAFAHRLRDRALVPTKDPRLADSLTFENF